MRHGRDHRQLSRTMEHRKALLRNLVTALFQYERIHTSVAKAKEARRLAERLITRAKRNDLHARRHVARFVYRETVTKKLFDTIAPWYMERPGGYTRIVRIGKRRPGDNSEVAFLELIKSPEQKAEDRKRREEALEAKEEAKKRSRRGGSLAAQAAAEVEESRKTAAEVKKKERSKERTTPKAAAEKKGKGAKGAGGKGPSDKKGGAKGMTKKPGE
ncbi:MAG TPA: 50S ribosomal protein L17 [Candidatus Eisenbacteria bacterium]|nr:50S ribosomal protein L17 [Candidatus Eisenbacteria bacterium]